MINITPETVNTIGKYIVWFVVLVAIGYVLGMVFQVSLFLLPGLLVVAAAYYLLTNMSEKGILQTLKDTMKKPIEWIMAALRTFLPGIFDKAKK